MSFSFGSHTALFGGSFNPPHFGHVEAVRGLFRNPGVGRVVLLPSFGTPLKEVGVSFEDRLEMTKTAFAPQLADGRTEVSTIERDHGLAFTWQVLEALQGRWPKMAFVIGTDQFVQLDRWDRYPEVMGMCDWIVLLRKPHSLPDFETSIRKWVRSEWLAPTANEMEFNIKTGRGGVLKFVTTDAPAISSTEIRTKLELGKTEEAKAWLPQSVLDFIERNKIYGK